MTVVAADRLRHQLDPPAGRRGDGDGAHARAAHAITRLGAGRRRAPAPRPRAVERTLDVLREYREVDGRARRRAGADRRRRRRRATRANRDDFFDAAEPRSSACRPSCSPATRRAGCRSAGATAELDPADGPFLVVDIGGGSTEFIVGTDRARGRRVGRHRVRAPHREVLHTTRRARGAELAMLGRAAPTSTTSSASSRRRRRGHARRAGRHGHHRRRGRARPATYDRDRIHHFRLTRAAAEDVFRTLATEPPGRPRSTTRASRRRGPTSSSAGCCVARRDHAPLRLRRVPGVARPTSSTGWRRRSPRTVTAR